jgi:hypothetical protein
VHGHRRGAGGAHPRRRAVVTVGPGGMAAGRRTLAVGFRSAAVALAAYDLSRMIIVRIGGLAVGPYERWLSDLEGCGERVGVWCNSPPRPDWFPERWTQFSLPGLDDDDAEGVGATREWSFAIVTIESTGRLTLPAAARAATMGRGSLRLSARGEVALLGYGGGAQAAGLIGSNPAAAIPKPRRRPSRRRLLDHPEIEELVNAIRAMSNTPDLDLLLIRFHLESGARREGRPEPAHPRPRSPPGHRLAPGEDRSR